VRYLVHLEDSPLPTLHPLAQLSPTQRNIAMQAAGGATLDEIAMQLARSTETVRTHLRAVYLRLGVRSRVELAEKCRGVGDKTRS
jgi:DNA-binding CsgD family transcriptional regulator